MLYIPKDNIAKDSRSGVQPIKAAEERETYVYAAIKIHNVNFIY